MNAGKLTGMAARFRQAIYQKSCLSCGRRMKEVDRCTEKISTFIWYKCAKGDCDGQWLQRISGFQLKVG